MQLDSNGLIVQQNLDAGDTLANQATWCSAVVMRGWKGVKLEKTIGEIVRFANYPLGWLSLDKNLGALELLETRAGVYVRNPSQGWWQNPLTTSRDQKIPAMMINGLLDQRRALWRMHWYLIKRFLFEQNTIRDGAEGPSQGTKIPDTWICHLQWFIRPYGPIAWLFWPLLLFIDLGGILKTLIGLIPFTIQDGGKIKWQTPDDVDVRNSVFQHLCAVAWAPTPFSWLSRKLFAKLYHKNFGNTVMGETNNVQGALAWYFRKEAGGNPEIAEALRQIILRYF